MSAWRSKGKLAPHTRPQVVDAVFAFSRPFISGLEEADWSVPLYTLLAFAHILTYHISAFLEDGTKCQSTCVCRGSCIRLYCVSPKYSTM